MNYLIEDVYNMINMLINIQEHSDIICMEDKNDDRKYSEITLIGNEVV